MPTLIDKTPPPSFARRKFIDPVRNKRTENADLEPTKLSTLKLNKTLPQGVSVKPQVDLLRSLDPAIVPDVPASYIPQPDTSYKALVAQPDRFHKYQTTQREAEESVGFFLDQELKREMADTNLNPYMYSRKQTKAENELNRLIAQPNRRLNPQEIFALENRILGEDPRLLPDYASLSYIVRHSAVLDFMFSRKIFENMTAWKTSFMNVLNNTFARLRINKPEWFIKVLTENGASQPAESYSSTQPIEPSGPSRTTARTPSGERTIVHAPPTAPVAPSMVTPPVPVPVTAPTAPTPQPVLETEGRIFDTTPPVQVETTQQDVPDVAIVPEEDAGIVTRPRPTLGQQQMTDFYNAMTRPTSGPIEAYSPPEDYGFLSFINSINNAAKRERTTDNDTRIIQIAQKAIEDGYNSDKVKDAVRLEYISSVTLIVDIGTAVRFLIEVLEHLRGTVREQRPITTATALLNQYISKKKKP